MHLIIMKLSAKLLIRVAAGALLFFALGHSAGHYELTHSADTGKALALKLMDVKKFDMPGGVQRSLAENLIGYSLIVATMLFTIIGVLIYLSRLAYPVLQAQWGGLAILAAGLAVVGAWCFMYFFALPGLSCLVAALALGFAAVRLQKDQS